MTAAGCNGKQRFESQSLAAQIARMIRRRHDNAKINTYRCKTCGGWHIGDKGINRS